MAESKTTEEANKKMIKLKSSDDQIIEVPEEVAKVSATIRDMLAALQGADESPDTTDDAPIPLPKVTSNILTEVMKWCEQHVGDPEVDKEVDLDEDEDYDFPDWDEDYIDGLEEDVLFEVILAADFLNIKMLLDLGCKRVANILKNMSVEEIRKKYNIKNDFPPEEYERLKKEFDFPDA